MIQKQENSPPNHERPLNLSEEMTDDPTPWIKIRGLMTLGWVTLTRGWEAGDIGDRGEEDKEAHVGNFK